MRHLLRCLAALSALAVIGSIAAHAAGITYTGTTTVTDVTNSNTVVGSSNFTFDDPPNSFYTDNYSINGLLTDGDILNLAVAFSTPGTGSANLGGEVDFSFIFHTNYIQWNSATTEDFTLSNGSIVEAFVPTFFFDPVVGLNPCSRGSANLCANTSVSILVEDNDPPLNPTPEPSSLALFGTGILGLAGVARRKFAV